MKTNTMLDTLNPAQKEAVIAPSGHYLILAGAGSGKTTVLVRRVAFLLETEAVSPYRILAVTFTNKAAGEMRSRIESLLGFQASGLSIGTFHRIAHQFLRRHWQEANLDQTFQIIDSDDQLRLIKRVLNMLNLDEKKWAPRNVQSFINTQKEEGRRRRHLEDEGDFLKKTFIKIYEAYEVLCKQTHSIDFAELLLSAFELLQHNPELLAHYRAKYQYILVDEFQDTNHLQYAFVRLLCGENNSLYIVGDDDQSIYGWRGAKVGNIHRFSTDYPSAKIIRLEQNYRSTGNILSAANEIISHNEQRLGKNLWTTDEQGEPISLYAAFNELDEARFITYQIQKWVNEGNKRSEVAILYRSNAQSRILEEALIQVNISYRIYGGLRFFERQEIKDALAYLRLLLNRHDDAAFERVINTPTRGIGERTLEQLRFTAKEKETSLWTALLLSIEQQSLPKRTCSLLLSFTQLINQLDIAILSLSLPEKIEHMLEVVGLKTFYQQEQSERVQTRIENLHELIAAAKTFQVEEDNTSPLSAFLTQAALEAGETQSGEGVDAVQLMTLHAAKGLEFPLVFMAGMEEGLFPHYLSIQDPTQIEEERRLCYVGMTRAMKKLYLSFAEVRRIYGSESRNKPSRFLRELPEQCIEAVRTHSKMIISPRELPTKTTSIFRLGARVSHPTFGEGIILNQEGNQEHLRLQVKFETTGTKWLVASYAKLTIL